MKEVKQSALRAYKQQNTLEHLALPVFTDFEHEGKVYTIVAVKNDEIEPSNQYNWYIYDKEVFRGYFEKRLAKLELGLFVGEFNYDVVLNELKYSVVYSYDGKGRGEIEKIIPYIYLKTESKNRDVSSELRRENIPLYNGLLHQLKIAITNFSDEVACTTAVDDKKTAKYIATSIRKPIDDGTGLDYDVFIYDFDDFENAFVDFLNQNNVDKNSTTESFEFERVKYLVEFNLESDNIVQIKGQTALEYCNFIL